MMNDLIKKIAKLPKRERHYYMVQVMFEDKWGIKDTDMLATLKRYPPEQRDVLIKAMPAGYAPIVTANLEKVAPGNDKTVAGVERKMALVLKAIPAYARKTESIMKVVNKTVLANRRLLRSVFAERGDAISDALRGRPRPLVQKPYPKNAVVIELPKPDRSVVTKADIYNLIEKRQSRRKYTNQPLSLAELSYLLWATQGVRRVSPDGKMSNRTVPSGGSMHPFETYVIVNNVEGVKPGLYRYQAIDHKLAFLREIKNRQDAVSVANLGQKFVGYCAATFIWTAVPYKTEWRYVTESAKLILLDAGHVCQNFYLACESIGCGTCAIGAYDQKKIDKLLKVDGSNELVVYLAPVGRVAVEKV